MIKRSHANAALFILYAACLYGVTLVFGNLPDGPQVTLVLIISGFGLGLAAQLVFDWSGTRRFWDVYLNAFWTILVFFVLLLIVSYETAICLVIGAPVIFVLLAVGMWVARALGVVLSGKTHLCLPLLALPFLTPFVDLGGLSPMTSYSVTTSVQMRGSPDQILALTQSVAPIKNAERPWTFTHSVLRAPRPVLAQVIDDVRYATWERGVTFEEVLLPAKDPNTLAWQFRFPNPELLGPIDTRVSPMGPEVFLDSGEYRFTELENGQTLVTLTTSYRLRTPLNGYLAIWGNLFLNDFHNAVLHVIASRAEEAT